MPRYPGGVIRKTPVIPAGPLQNGAAPGVWTLGEAAYWVKQGLWPTAGNFLAVEDVFSTYLYTGNGSTQTITNGLDVSGQGGMVWIKSRSAATNNFLFDTTRGANAEMNSNTTDASASLANSVTAFNTTGFALGSAAGINTNAATYVSWTFRETPKFFDVVTFVSDGTANQRVSHNLGVAPGMILVKRSDGVSNWYVYHRSQGINSVGTLQTTGAFSSTANAWGSSDPTATDFGINSGALTATGSTQIAYLFAHDPTADGLIQCGSYTGNGSTSGPVVNLGWEPQWVMLKCATSGGTNWVMLDNMRGMPVGSASRILFANTSGAEGSDPYISPTATGFQVISDGAGANLSGATYTYIAIRRGPMKTPTVGTSVFKPITRTPPGNTAVTISGIGFPPDLAIFDYRSLAYGAQWVDRLRGVNRDLTSSLTDAEYVYTPNTGVLELGNDSISLGVDAGDFGINKQASPQVDWIFRRAPGFFDVVCYTGTGSAQTITHNLSVPPELIIVKKRNVATNWIVLNDFSRSGSTQYGQMYLDLTNSLFAASYSSSGALISAPPTSSSISLKAWNGVSFSINKSGEDQVAYLFASCPGVSKVGTYTGNGSSQTINCGFSSGARFFLVKRTDSTGDWWVWDSARGITAPADPALRLNSTAAEVTSADATDPDNSGIIVNQETTCNINVNGATYIFLAIA